MSSVGSFTASLSELDVPWTRSTVDALDGVLDDVLAPPTVAAPLGLDGYSLTDRSDVTLDPTPGDLDGATTGLTAAGPAIADYGSVVVRADAAGSEPVSLYCERHVAVVAESAVLPSMRAAIGELGDAIRDGLTGAVVATGPSATADMGELVYGAHGPTEVHVVVVEGR
ncbi:LUD domain-containing protein [Halomarina oriensis]|uniref:Lactate utilization protein C n=1 Tax=Halomarina oriensis TaxID=671145 RepID=A0A6B0GQL0_9EURY|nr:LUD domain-containing protein [Halomarina oriensis]MWG36361.1 lactate utilization protein C [Halomarina oriensis]